MSRQDWYSDLMTRSFEGIMERLLKDSRKTFESEMEKVWKVWMEGMPPLEFPFNTKRPLDTRAAYSMLGLEDTASDEEIKKRYRDLAKRLHPDVAGKETEHLFKLVQMAYEQISGNRGWK